MSCVYMDLQYRIRYEYKIYYDVVGHDIRYRRSTYDICGKNLDGGLQWAELPPAAPGPGLAVAVPPRQGPCQPEPVGISVTVSEAGSPAAGSQ